MLAYPVAPFSLCICIIYIYQRSYPSPPQDALYALDSELLYTGDYGMRGQAPAPPVQGTPTRVDHAG
jgi:hypothetical protein